MWRLPIIPSATTADSSDSIAAKSATVTAGEKSSRTRSIETAGNRGVGNRGVDLAETGTDRLDRNVKDRHRHGGPEDRHDRARDLRSEARPHDQDEERPDGDTESRERRRAEVRRKRRPLLQEMRGHVSHLESQEVLDLGRKDDDRDTAREARDDGIGNELDGGAEPREAEGDEQESRHHGAEDEAVDAVLLDDAVHDDDEGPRRAADLNAAAAQEGDEEPRHRGRDEASFRCDSRRDGEGKGERDRHDADDDTRLQVREELPPVVVPEDDERLGEPGCFHGAGILQSRSGPGLEASCWRRPT